MHSQGEQCVCPWCGWHRPHTPGEREGCRGCRCDEPYAQKTHRVRLRIATIPKPYKDVAELLTSVGGDAAYERMIAEAKPGPAWMIDNLETHGYELVSPEGQQDAVDAMLATLLSLPLIERGAYVRRLAERLEMPEADLRKALNEAYVRNGREMPFRNVPEYQQRASLDIP